MSLLSFWEKETYYADSDIAIIGGGLMGLWTALELKKQVPSLKITILERHVSPLGASTRNAGFACFGSLTELLSDEAKMGTDAMLQIVAMRFKGIEKIKSTINPNAIDLDLCLQSAGSRYSQRQIGKCINQAGYQQWHTHIKWHRNNWMG
ncbi:MAG: FAD dependent oxidoreductase [Chitinophagaceae bacterium]|nr:MAG: FAD dependent oxidoreductase [Chitinophagaceae bacterium]